MIALPLTAKKQIRVEARTYRGKNQVDVRQWYQDGNGEWLPSHRGVTVPRDQGADLAQAIMTELAGDDG